MPASLLQMFPGARDLLALSPEELGAVLLEVIPGVIQNGRFAPSDLISQVYGSVAPGRYPRDLIEVVELAIGEAISLLIVDGLLVIDIGQPQGLFYKITRRGELKSRADVAAFRRAHILPRALLPNDLVEKVWPLFARGDHVVAVFQAFKEVEVRVRSLANALGAGYPDNLVGVKLMRTAFNASDGPLRDTSVPQGEQVAMMELYAGAIGHAKNPASHRDVVLKPDEAARLIVLASHLIEQLGRAPL